MKKLPTMTLALAAIVCMLSCSKDDSKEPSLNKTKITLYVDETEKLTYSGNDECTWSSDNKRVADVNNGVVTANHVGTTTIHANNLACEVIVKPRYTSFTEPYLEFGSSKSEVKSQMSGYTLKSEDNTMLTYYGKGNVDNYGYQFKYGALEMSAFYTELSCSLSLSDFLLERYLVFDSEKSSTERIYTLVSVDLKMFIQFRVGTYGCIVMYTKA